MRGVSSVYLNSAIFGGGIYNTFATVAAGSIRQQQPSGTSTVTMRDFTTVHDNSAIVEGGGIYTNAAVLGFQLSTRAIRQKVLPTAQVIVQDGSSVYHNNVRNLGGGVYSDGDAVLISNTGSVHDNTASNWGGGIYNSRGIVQLIDHGSVYRNSALSGGGVYNDDGGVGIYDNTSIHDNTATGTAVSPVSGGGGVYNLSDTPGEGDLFTVNYSSIYHNMALDGAGVYNDGDTTGQSYVELDNFSTVTRNVASRNGAGIFNTPTGAVTANDETSVDHNVAGSQGGGLYAMGTPPASIVLWGTNAIHLNTPNNCYPTATFTNCTG
jgi:predicted outer membrane repeat protein